MASRKESDTNGDSSNCVSSSSVYDGKLLEPLIKIRCNKNYKDGIEQVCECNTNRNSVVLEPPLLTDLAEGEDNELKGSGDLRLRIDGSSVKCANAASHSQALVDDRSMSLLVEKNSPLESDLDLDLLSTDYKVIKEGRKISHLQHPPDTINTSTSCAGFQKNGENEQYFLDGTIAIADGNKLNNFEVVGTEYEIKYCKPNSGPVDELANRAFTCTEKQFKEENPETSHEDSVSSHGFESAQEIRTADNQQSKYVGHLENKVLALGNELQDDENKRCGLVKSHYNFNAFDISDDEDSLKEKYKPLMRKGSEEYFYCEQQSKKDAACHKRKAEKLMIPGIDIENKRYKMPYKVVYLHSEDLKKMTNGLIRIEDRAELVHSLIESFGLLQYLEVLSPRIATDAEILGFHCPSYVDFLRSISDHADTDDDTESFYTEAEGYGLSYDCPLQKGIFQTASLISGATIVAAETLVDGTADIAINWYGGWHHAKRDAASGFCYINDIVLGILKLRESFDRVLYVDLDLHHGDGVEDAFSMTPRVMTVSFHKYCSGFFPGSGSIDSIGTGRGKFYTLNVPLLDGIKDAEFFSVFRRVMNQVKEKFKADAVVVQCGADGMSGDPMASFNLTHIGLARCVCCILAWGLPTLLLGGGGYNFPNTAKCWTFITALAAGRKLPLDIPEHEHLLEYGPGYEMSTSIGNRQDCNTKEYLDKIFNKISQNLNHI